MGRDLAAQLAYDFLDTDRIICQRKGASIETIVSEEGWEEFRRLENEVLSEFSGCRNCVVATGGGAIIHRQVWRMLRLNSLVVWLTASPAVLISRFRQDEGKCENRPSLTGRDMATEMRESSDPARAALSRNGTSCHCYRYVAGIADCRQNTAGLHPGKGAGEGVMAGNTFGRIFRVTTWGESHGTAIGAVSRRLPGGHSHRHR